MMTFMRRKGNYTSSRASADEPRRDRASDADITQVHPLRVPCRTCRRGLIAMFEVGTSARGRRVACPACAGTGFV